MRDGKEAANFVFEESSGVSHWFKRQVDPFVSDSTASMLSFYKQSWLLHVTHKVNINQRLCYKVFIARDEGAAPKSMYGIVYIYQSLCKSM